MGPASILGRPSFWQSAVKMPQGTDLLQLPDFPPRPFASQTSSSPILIFSSSRPTSSPSPAHRSSSPSEKESGTHALASLAILPVLVVEAKLSTALSGDALLLLECLARGARSYARVLVEPAQVGGELRGRRRETERGERRGEMSTYEKNPRQDAAAIMRCCCGVGVRLERGDGE